MQDNEIIENIAESDQPLEIMQFIIYLLVNKINGMIYVGQTIEKDPKDRMGRDGGKYCNSTYLFNAINFYGSDNFFYHILERIEGTADDACDYEHHYMTEFDAKNHDIGYNIKDASSRGKHAQETKDKISATLKAQYETMTPEEKLAKAAPINGWWLGKERAPQSQEQRDANSVFMIERHKTQGHPMQGKHHTEEAKAKIGAANKGRTRTPETIAKMILAQAYKKEPEKELQIIKDYQNGMIIKDIESKFKTSRSHIYRIFNRHNIIRKRNL